MLGIILTIIVILFVIAASKTEEKENLIFFGSEYENYMKRTKMFIPYLF